MRRCEVPRRPTLSSSCARAATAQEAAFRISYPVTGTRASRVIALDSGAAHVVHGLSRLAWHGGRFLAVDRLEPVSNGHGKAADALLRLPDGSPALLSSELDGADVAVMVATWAARPEVASVIGDACAMRWVMSAGLVIAGPVPAGAAEAADTVDDGEKAVEEVVAALRPNAMVLAVLRGSDDIAGILSALRV